MHGEFGYTVDYPLLNTREDYAILNCARNTAPLELKDIEY